MTTSKTLGRVVFFTLGYLAGTRAGRERYAQIEASAKAVIENSVPATPRTRPTHRERHRTATDTATSSSATDRQATTLIEIHTSREYV